MLFWVHTSVNWAYFHSYIHLRSKHALLGTHLMDSMLVVYICQMLVRKERLTSMVEHLLMVRWVIGSIPHGGPVQLFPIPASAARLL